MTAIGATPEGVDEAEVTRRVELLRQRPDLVAGYAVDVRRWIVGPFHGGPADAIEVRFRALALVELVAGRPDLPNRDTPPAPGSVDDPAYSSPTPVAGPSGLEDPTMTVERESPAGTRVPAEVRDERERTADERDPASGSWDDEDGASATAIADRAAAENDGTVEGS
jgi:hypothetical protein